MDWLGDPPDESPDWLGDPDDDDWLGDGLPDDDWLGLGLPDVGGVDEGLLEDGDGLVGVVGGLVVGLVVVGLLVGRGLLAGGGWFRLGACVEPSTDPYTRVAWNNRVQRTGASRTFSPLRGASTIMPLPAYMATW